MMAADAPDGAGLERPRRAGTLERMLARPPGQGRLRRRRCDGCASRPQPRERRRQERALLGLLGAWPDKLLVFTRFRATQEHLARVLAAAGHDRRRLPRGLRREEKEDGRPGVRRSLPRAGVSPRRAARGATSSSPTASSTTTCPGTPCGSSSASGACRRVGQTRDVHVFNLVGAGDDRGDDPGGARRQDQHVRAGDRRDRHDPRPALPPSRTSRSSSPTSGSAQATATPSAPACTRSVTGSWTPSVLTSRSRRSTIASSATRSPRPRPGEHSRRHRRVRPRRPGAAGRRCRGGGRGPLHVLWPAARSGEVETRRLAFDPEALEEPPMPSWSSSAARPSTSWWDWRPRRAAWPRPS